MAYNEAVRALDQQRVELDSLRGRAATIFASAGIISAFFASFVLEPKKGLGWLEWVAVGAFCGVALSALPVLWPWKWWKWVPPGKDLVDKYVDGENRVSASAMHRDLAIHLGANLEHNQRRLNALYVLLMVGIGCLGLEVVSWVVAV